MTIVLSDFSQTVISSVVVNAKEFRGADSKDLIKHVALNQILALKKKFNGKLILCCDSKNYWRKQEFPDYKGHRKHAKADDEFLDWNMVYETINELKEELKENFPYMVLEVEGAEADDIIGVLTKYFDENEMENTGLIEEPQPVVIASTDGDFYQLQKYRNVQQWNNTKKSMMKCPNPKMALIEKIVTGDAGDNVPNICTGNWWSKARSDGESVRAKAFKKSRIQDFYNKGIDACLDDEERINYLRNEKLVDLDFIPREISSRILSAYLNYEYRGNKGKIFNYLTAHRMKQLMGSYNEF